MARVICIGGSTGAPLALAEVLKDLPPDFPAPILVALHMPPAMTASYVRTLEGRCPLRAALAENNAFPEAGRVYVAPGGLHIGLNRVQRIITTPNPDGTAFKPSIDVLFYTAAQAAGSDAVALVMTGLSTRRDAVDGALAVRRAGGLVIVQNDPANPFLGMPKNVIDAGAASEVRALKDLPKRLIELAA